jgi:hypothetical protein
MISKSKIKKETIKDHILKDKMFYEAHIKEVGKFNFVKYYLVLNVINRLGNPINISK